MASSEMSAGSEWRLYWTVVLAGVLGMTLNTVHIYSTGVFIAPLEAEFGWSRSRIMFGFTLYTCLGAIMAPFFGMLVDRVGPRRLGLTGVALYCCALGALSQAVSSIWSWWSLWILLAFGGLMIKPTVWTAAVSSLFSQGRGLALAVTLCGTGLGSALVPTLAYTVIDNFGWRGGYIMLAGISFLLVFPAAYLFLNSAADIHRRKPAGTEVPTAYVLRGMKVREALLSWRFFKIAIAAFTVTLAIIAFVMNLVPIMNSNGISRTMAVTIAGAVGITSIIGRLATGYLLDRVNGNVIGGLVVLAPIFSCLCFIFAPESVAVTIVAVVVLGLALGAELDVIAYLVTRHFGLRSFGTIFGTIVGLWSVATGLGPLITSYTYDITGSYQVALWLYIPMFLIASAALFSLGHYPDFSSFEAKANALDPDRGQHQGAS